MVSSKSALSCADKRIRNADSTREKAESFNPAMISVYFGLAYVSSSEMLGR